MMRPPSLAVQSSMDEGDLAEAPYQARPQDPRIGGREGVIPKFIWPHPTHLLTDKWLWLSRHPVAEMHHKTQLLMAISVINADQFSTNLHLDTEFLLQLVAMQADRFLAPVCHGNSTSLPTGLPLGAGQSTPPPPR